MTLVKADGTLTKAGRAWQRLTGEELPSSGAWDPSTEPVRDGDTEHLRLRDNNLRVLRRWDPASNDWIFTTLGRQFRTCTVITWSPSREDRGEAR